MSIDGPSASGKTTLGRGLAARLQLPFLDTGLTFRTMAFLCSDEVAPPSFEKVSKAIGRVGHEMFERSRHRSADEVVRVDGYDVTHLIWSEQCNAVLPWITDNATIREVVHAFHRHLLRSGGIAAGRDVALTLMPDADLKIVLRAEFDVRRERRRRQVAAGGDGTVVLGASSPLDALTLETVERDPRGLIIDTSRLTPAEVYDAAVTALGL